MFHLHLRRGLRLFKSRPGAAVSSAPAVRTLPRILQHSALISLRELSSGTGPNSAGASKSIEDMLRELLQAVDGMTTRMQSVESGQEKLRESMKSVEERMNSVESGQEKLRQSVDRSAGGFTEIMARDSVAVQHLFPGAEAHSLSAPSASAFLNADHNTSDDTRVDEWAFALASGLMRAFPGAFATSLMRWLARQPSAAQMAWRQLERVEGLAAIVRSCMTALSDGRKPPEQRAAEVAVTAAARAAGAASVQQYTFDVLLRDIAQVREAVEGEAENSCPQLKALLTVLEACADLGMVDLPSQSE